MPWHVDMMDVAAVHGAGSARHICVKTAPKIMVIEILMHECSGHIFSKLSLPGSRIVPISMYSNNNAINLAEPKRPAQYLGNSIGARSCNQGI
jgi:hypothetical protein